MHSCYTYQVILHDCIVLGIVSESQTQILPRPIERAEVKFSLSDTFSFIFTMVSNRFVRECFVVVVFFRTHVILKTTSVFSYTFCCIFRTQLKPSPIKVIS